MKTITLALAGNPNSGKTMTFNNLTHAHQHVANYPGVTIEQKEGCCNYRNCKFDVVDLPGIYGLTSHSEEERVARDFILGRQPDVIVNIIDTEHLEKSLYLTLQLLELQIPVLVCLNMYKTAESKGIVIDENKLSDLLGVPVLKMEAKTNQGICDILQSALDLAPEKQEIKQKRLQYEERIDQAIESLASRLDQQSCMPGRIQSSYWCAIKLLEGDEQVIESIYDAEVLDHVFELRHKLEQSYSEESETVIAQARYAQIAGIVHQVQKQVSESHRNITELLDTFLLNRIFGLPLFFLVMWIVFQLVFRLSAIPTNWINLLIGASSDFLGGLINNTLVRSLVVDGILGGVGGVLVFIPQIVFLFIVLAVLEDTGYMARAAFLMDNWMHKVGLHGKSFVPMILGFGCSVPAVMATRTLATRREKIVTSLMVPFISCSARMPVYGLLIGAFFPVAMGGNILFSLYLIGIGSAILIAKILGKYLVRDEEDEFVLELPIYRMPTLRSVYLYSWHKLRHYLQKAGTVILAASVVVWVLTSFPQQVELENTLAGRLGNILAVILEPLGFNWQISIALLIGFSAKELVVSTLSTIYHVANNTEGLTAVLQNDPAFTPLVAYVLMLFVLLYTPCLATVAIIRQEIGKKWAFVSIALSTSWAWLVCFIVYRTGLFLGY